MSEDDPLRDTRDALVVLTELVAASVAASLARAGDIVGPRVQHNLWPEGAPSPLDIHAMRRATRSLSARPIDRSPVLDDVLSLMPHRVAPSSLAELTLEIANLLIHIGHRLEQTKDADERFRIALAAEPCVVEAHFVLAMLLVAADDERLSIIAAPIGRAVDELIALAARCNGTAEA